MSKVILLADDSLDDQILFQRIVQSAGIINPIQVVRDGQEAICYIEGKGKYSDRGTYPAPKILVLDLLMHGVDGWDVLKWLQQHPQKNQMLVIVTTQSSQISRLQEAYRLGANSFILKPLKKVDLDSFVGYWPDVWMLAKDEPSQSPPP